jgi:Sec7-like guanine-nucleotide exchange factor
MTNSRSNTWHDQNSSWIDFNWSSNDSSDDGITSFGSKNSSSKASVSGKRKVVPLAWKCEISHCSISKAIFGKLRDSRKNYITPIFFWFIPTRLFRIPQNQTHAEREKIWRHRGHLKKCNKGIVGITCKRVQKLFPTILWAIMQSRNLIVEPCILVKPALK